MTEATRPRSLRYHQTTTLALLFLAGVLNYLDRSSLSVANTTVRAEMHLSATQMGWLLSAFSLAYGIAQLPLIGLLDRIGTRWVLGFGLILWSFAQGATGLVRSFGAFLVMRVLLGIGEGPFYPSGIRATREWFTPATRGRATGLMSSSSTFGMALAPPLLTVIMLRSGWRDMFILLGVVGVVIAALWLALHRARRDVEAGNSEQGTGNSKHAAQEVSFRAQRSEAEEPTHFAHATTEARSEQSTLSVLLRQRTVWGMMLGWGGINYTVWLYLAWLPAYLTTARHLTLASTGWIASVPYLAGACGMLSNGFITDALARTGIPLTTIHRRILVGGMIVSAGATFLVAHSQTTTQAVAAISAALAFIHFAGTSGWGYVQAVSPMRYVASLSALQNFASFMIASAAPVITGWLLDRTHSFTIALGVCAAVTLLGALSYATLAAPGGMRLNENAHATADR